MLYSKLLIQKKKKKKGLIKNLNNFISVLFNYYI